MPSGPAAAALLAAGLGVSAIGLATVLTEAAEPVRRLLNWDVRPGGTLVGKSSVGVIVWLSVWLALHLLWKSRDVKVEKIVAWTMLLVFLGFLFTFPPVFRVFAR